MTVLLHDSKILATMYLIALQITQKALSMDANKPQNVVVTDIQMPFMSMVIFMVKWVIAAIPAMLILTLLGAILTVLFGGLLSKSF